ncbi:MAG TPA: MFS transporter, partial [Chthonomonadales bacterium]|nr:MFS transporter [Chthonomonadales bacterium]
MKQPFSLRTAFLLGLGFLGITAVGPITNNFVPIFLKEMGLPATLVGFVMTWDNYLNLFIQPIVGARSDRTRTRIGRRKPWIAAGAPVAAAG